MIRTWMADVSKLLEEQTYFSYYKKVPKRRQGKADKMAAQEGKALSIGAWTLLEMMREEYQLTEGNLFNLSHSGKYVLCSVDDSGKQGVRLGCDIEEIKHPRMEVARHFFCESEIQYIVNRQTEEAQKEAFYRYWVLKESFMKATRLGMKLGLDEFEIKIEEENVPYLLRQPEQFPEKYYYKEYIIEGIPYKVAVCSTDSEFSNELRKVVL